MSFNYKDSQYNKKYLLRLWMYLYYSNPKSVSRHANFKKTSRIKKIDWREKQSFKTYGVTINEIQIIRDSLLKLPKEDLESLALLMNTTAINDSPRILLVDSLKKLGQIFSLYLL